MPPAMPLIPSHVAALFAAYVLLVAAGLVAGVHAAGRSPRLTGGVAVGLLAWLAASGALARRGALLDWSAVPPRFAIVVLPPLLFAAALAFTPLADRVLRVTPPGWPIAAQTFRVGVEALLWLLSVHGAVAPLMTFHGRNFDVLTGLTAPVAAWLCFGGGRRRTGLALAWNAVGLALLVNVVTHGILSTPAPFQLFHTTPPNTIVARFPTVWLVSFFVPLAFALHALSIRQIVRGLAVPVTSGGGTRARLSATIR